MQPVEKLKGQPPAAVFTSGFDPLRDVGYEYAHKLDQAGVPVSGRHYAHLTHGWLQMTGWSKEAVKATEDVGRELRRLVYGSEE
jgi:acetyl esterase/lipase